MTDTTPTTDAAVARLSTHEQRTAVRERYGRIATESGSGYGGTGSSNKSSTDTSKKVGYSDDELICEWDDERDLSDYIVAATIEGTKPRTESQP